MNAYFSKWLAVLLAMLFLGSQAVYSDPADYNLDNSPYSLKNSPYNVKNSPYHLENSPYNIKNSPYSINSGRRTYDVEGNSTGYAVENDEGTVNYFNDDGERTGYRPRFRRVE